MAQQVKNLPATQEPRVQVRSLPGSGRSLAGGNGSILQCSCLENPANRAWRATVHEVTKRHNWAMSTARQFPYNTESINTVKDTSLPVVGQLLASCWPTVFAQTAASCSRCLFHILQIKGRKHKPWLPLLPLCFCFAAFFTAKNCSCFQLKGFCNRYMGK